METSDDTIELPDDTILELYKKQCRKNMLVSRTTHIYDDLENNILNINDSIVKVKKEIIIPDESVQFHGITNRISKKHGIELEIILQKFFDDLLQVDVLVGHNVYFDIDMVKIELLRLIKQSDLSYDEKKTYKLKLHYLTNFKNIFCTAQSRISIDICNLKAIDKFGKEYLKYPKLIELHQVLFNSTPNNLHNALYDIMVTLRCYIELKYSKDLKKTCNKFKRLAKEISLY